MTNLSPLTLIQQQDSTRGIALYADEKVTYGKIVEILDMAARRKMKMVLATKALQEGTIDTDTGKNESHPK